MPDELRKSVETLSRISQRFNKLTDEANEAVRLAEGFLDDCSLGMSEFVRVSEEKDEAGETLYTILRYDRVGGRFRIAVEQGYNPDRRTFKPWSDWSREIKLKTMPFVPDLLIKIASTLNDRAKDAEQSVKSVVEAVRAAVPKIMK